MADRWDSALYEDRHSFVWKSSSDLIEKLDPKPGERVLDLGCGTGHLTAQIAERGAETIGIDSSASMIAQARQNYPKIKVPACRRARLRIRRSFRDAVFSNAALHWIPEADSVVRSVAKALQTRRRLSCVELGAQAAMSQRVYRKDLRRRCARLASRGRTRGISPTLG